MHPFGSFCWEFIVWSTTTDIQAIYIYIYIYNYNYNYNNKAANIYIYIDIYEDRQPA